ncbi:hypothetical protein [Simplicispira sp. 110]|uniref:hypothetical protein n=1 Tax=Simplicispira sp. 110 TaxID=2135640 RepID=UPI001F2328B8|nr:hypothetical protein [Simplicispira sp. 110]
MGRLQRRLHFLPDTPQCAFACGVFVELAPAGNLLFCGSLVLITVFDRYQTGP